MSANITGVVKLIKANPDLKPLNGLSESAVKQAIVVPLLEAAGWNSRSVTTEFVTEYGVTKGGNDKVDYSLRLCESNKVFVEAKKPSEDLHGHAKQLENYCQSADDAPDIGVLTNGRFWWLYSPSPSKQGGWKKPRRFCSIDIASDRPGEVRKKFRFLLKADVRSGKASTAAGREYGKLLRNKRAKEAIVEAWNRVVQTPDESLIDLLTGVTERICATSPPENMVRGFLTRNVGQFVVANEQYKSNHAPSSATFNSSGKKPHEIRLGDHVRSVSGWPAVLYSLCVQIYDNLELKEEFDKVLEIRGSRNPYFSKDGTDLQNPKRIDEIGIYVEREGIAGQRVLSICGKMLKLFGYAHESVQIRITDSATGSDISVMLPRRN